MLMHRTGALDDTGCGFADLDTVRLLKPEIVELCITAIRNADKGESFTAAIRASADKLGELGSKVLAEGVGTAVQHEALQNCGIELAQGWLYGQPEAIASVLSPQVTCGRHRETVSKDLARANSH
jgi:EAL domain-containing protein (putative c-di-GMP-specific phosphodiesterase class I)